MSIDYNKIYRLDNSFEIEQKNDETLYFDLENSNWFRTNETGSLIFQMCDGKKKLSDVIKEIADNSGFNESYLVEKFDPFIGRAIERKLLLEENENHVILPTDFCKYPNDLWIHVSEECNMHCPFCYSSSGTSDVNILNYNEIISFVEKIPMDVRNNIIISGGEPFLYKSLPQLVKKLNEMKFKITVISNGTVGNDIYKEVLPYITTLQISIDGTTKEYFEYTRGKDNFDKAVRSLHLAHELGMRNIVISFTSNSYNIQDARNLARFANDNHVNHIHVTRIIPSGRGNDVMNTLVPDPKQFGNAMVELVRAIEGINLEIRLKRESIEMLLPDDEKTKFLGITIAGNPFLKVIKQTKITTCSLGTGTISINYDGNVYPCGCLHIEQFKLGTINDDIKIIMEAGEKFANQLSVDCPDMKECHVCKYKYICGTGCRACSYANGDIKSKDPMCEQYIESIQSILWGSPLQ